MRPSHSAMKLTSSPRRYSSITSRPRSVPSAASASARSCAMITPLPAARPSAFSTTGKPKRSSALRASAGFSTVTNCAVGISLCAQKVLCENLTAFQLRRLSVRTDDLQSARAEFVHHSGHQRRLGSDHRQVRSDFFRRGGQAASQRQACADPRDPRISRRANTSRPATEPASTPARVPVRHCQ